MHKNATFLILLGTLLVAGGVVLGEWEKAREWQGRQQLLNRQHVSPAGNMPSTPEINPATGWKIFRDKNVPITFEYPQELSYTEKNKNPEQNFLGIGFDSKIYSLSMVFSPEGKGLPNSVVSFGNANLRLGGEEFSVDLMEDKDDDSTFIAVPPKEKINNIFGVHYPSIAFHMILQCKDSCDRSEALSILKQIVSSIHLASDTR